MQHEDHDVIMGLGRFIEYDDGVYQWLNLNAGDPSSPQFILINKLFPYMVTVTLLSRFDSKLFALFKTLAVAPVLIACNGYQNVMTCNFRDEASAVQFTALMDLGEIEEFKPYDGMPLWNGILR